MQPKKEEINVLGRPTGLEIREGIFDNVPHIIIGKDKPVQPLNYPRQLAPHQQPIYPPEKDLIDKLKNYALIFFTCLIL